MTELSTASGAVQHAVTFFDTDADLVRDLGRYVADGLTRGERIIVIATGSHRDALDEVLIQYGEDPARARMAGRYLTLDAAETLAKFLSDGSPDRQRFFDVVGTLVDAAGEDGCAVRTFGEMVALLWQDGNVSAALELESLWNELLAKRRCVLLCAYPAPLLADAALTDANRVCQLHSDVAAPRAYATRSVDEQTGSQTPHRVSDVFLPVAAAIPAARQFVIATLRAWGQDKYAADAALITSELATNAVIHAQSPFQLRIDRHDSRIRLTLDDVGPTRPEVRDAAPDAFGGRGVSIVEQLSVQWGVDVLADRKAVWAEFSLAG